MSDRSSNLPSPRFSGTPSKQFNSRQPLYLQPNSPHMSPRGRMSSPRNNHGSSDFISFSGNNQRQLLHFPPKSPQMSPQGNRLSLTSPRNNSGHSGSPDFIPLGVSSPVHRPRQSFNRPNNSYNSSYSSVNSSPSSNSSFNFSPYRRNNSRGNFRGRGGFNSSNGGSPHISQYVHKDMLQDPWQELEKKMRDLQQPTPTHTESEDPLHSTVEADSGSEVSSGEDDDEEGDDS